VDCTDLTVDSHTATGQESFSACRVLTLGPDFNISTTGVVDAAAGDRVVLTSGFSMAAGGSLTVGVAPAPR